MTRPANTLPGTAGPIRLERTAEGVATIHADSRDDALRGLGYCHARDRGLQILFVRILGRGEGSRWFEASDRMLAIDQYFRRLNFLGDVQAAYGTLSPASRAAIDAYSDGVNAFFTTHGLPWELRLTGYPKAFHPWTFADSVLTGKMIGYVSLSSTQGEVERWIVECVRAGVPTEALDELFPGKLGALDVDLIRRVTLGAPVVPPDLWSVAGLPWAVASNSWVVAGSRTESGLPILANDPHLEINRIPPVWYEAALSWSATDGSARYAIGATMPGTPGVVLGRNTDVAWGVTYSYMDCIDSWIEDCRDGLHRRGDDWKPLRVRDETIERKGKSPVTVRFFETENHGNLEGDPAEPGLYLATRWSCGEGTAAGTVEAIIHMLDATTADEGRSILAGLSNSAWNWVLADTSGAIASQMSGVMPLRREGTSGLVPLPGWDEANDWRGFAAFEDLPRALNPADGLIVAANNDLNSLGRLKPINLEVAPYRAERIRRLLESAGDSITVADMLTIQRDLKSTQAERFMRFLRPLLDSRRDDPRAEVLRRWDLDYGGDSRGATAFERFYQALHDDVFGRRLGPAALAHLRNDTILLGEFYHVFDQVLLSERSRWFGPRTRTEVYQAALEIALAEDAGPHRQSPPIKFRHILLGGKLPGFLGFDRGPYELPGGRATVSQYQVITLAGREAAGAPSIRMVADLATDEIHTALPGGPSDRRFSPWYGNEIDDYLAGKTKVIRGTD